MSAGVSLAFDDPHQVEHDAIEFEVFWGVDGRNASEFELFGLINAPHPGLKSFEDVVEHSRG